MGLVFFENRKGEKFFCCKEMKELNAKNMATGNTIELWNDGQREFLEAKFCPFCGTEWKRRNKKKEMK